MSQEDIDLKINNNEISKNYKLPEQMRIAKAIYRWVAKNIKYDYETYESILKDNGNWKPQNAIFVYSQKTGVCSGYAALTNVMMRMAGVPSANICSIKGRNSNYNHAFNAIYLEDSTSNQEGWTLIDSTWADPNSDVGLQTTEKDEVQNLIEGTGYVAPDFIAYQFNRDDDYAKEVGKLLDIPWKEQSQMDKDAIAKLNKDTEEKLSTLNEECKAGTKIEKIEFFKDNYELQIKYKTNLTLEDAVKLNKEKEEKLKIQKEKFLINNNMNCEGIVFDYDSDNLSNSLYDRLKEINLKKDSTKLDKETEYSKRVKTTFANVVQKYKYDMWGNIENINKEMQAELDKINPEYQDIVTFKDFKVYEDASIGEKDGHAELAISAATSLSYDEAKIIASSQNNLGALSNMKVYFPGFYNTKKDFTEANKSILNNPVHKVEKVDNRTTGEYYDNEYYNFEVNGIKYELDGHEGNAYISMKGDCKEPAENVQIPSDLASLGMKFIVLNGIKSIILNGDETIDISSSFDIRDINTEKSNKYIAEDGILYEKNTDGSKGSALNVFKTIGEINGVTCYFKKEYRENKVINIEIANYKGDEFANIKLPEQLTQFNVPVIIGYGINSVTLNGNERIQINEYSTLKTLDITNSNIYYEKDGKLYEEGSNEEVKLPDNVTIIKNH